MMLLEILRAKAIFLLLLFLTVVLPAWALITYYRSRSKQKTSKGDDKE
ncbi:MAG: hypothetical protein HRU12_15715 [Phaeodactylibacter sp.]|nr:hypothetical protein [Phaeodactylibacter sp.]